MKLATVRNFALALPEVTEEPHHNFGSLRVRGKIFVTVPPPPEREHIHVFVSEQQREQAFAMYPAFADKLLWGGKVVGVRVTLALAPSSVVKSLVRHAWENKAPSALLSQVVK